MSLSAALGKIASGLYIVTARTNEKPVGMLCSFIEQCGFEPPMISLALGIERPMCALLESGTAFGVNILSKENTALMKAFVRGDVADPFAGFAMVDNPNNAGIPQFADALAFLGCHPVTQVTAGDHIVFIAQVMEGVLQQPKAEPMIRIRANGLSY